MMPFDALRDAFGGHETTRFAELIYTEIILNFRPKKSDGVKFPNSFPASFLNNQQFVSPTISCNHKAVSHIYANTMSFTKLHFTNLSPLDQTPLHFFKVVQQNKTKSFRHKLKELKMK